MNAISDIVEPPVLDVRGLELGITGPAQRVLVDKVSFSLRPGRTLALVGESGSGKTLTALSILDLLPNPPVRIIKGDICFDGQNLAVAPPAALRRVRGGEVAMIFQEPQSALNPVMRIGDQLREAILAHEKLDRRALKARIIELLEMVRMPDPARAAREFPHRLSGGMRQRILIAMSMAANPRVLIADEPMTALDVTVQREILEMLAQLQQKFGLAVLLITHDLGLVADYADDVVVMYSGRVVERGPARAVLKSPLHPYTRGLLGARPGLEPHAPGHRPRLAEISGTVAQAGTQVEGCPFHPRCTVASEQCRLRAPELTVTADANHWVSCFKYVGSA